MHRQQRWQFYREHLNRILNTTAVFAVSDYYAVDFIGFLNEQGIRVPEEIAVVGFDDTPLCQMVSPSLTTVRQDGALRARIAIEKLRELKEGRQTETQIRLPVQLVVRRSSRT